MSIWFRIAAEKVMNDMSIIPLDEALLSITQEVDIACKEREKLVTDYDSYRRRIKAAREKLEKAKATSELTPTPANAKKVDEATAEMEKLHRKLDVAEKGYNSQNTAAKILLKESRRTILALVEKHVVTSLTCQVFL
jgi:hypothetical protein